MIDHPEDLNKPAAHALVALSGRTGECAYDINRTRVDSECNRPYLARKKYWLKIGKREPATSAPKLLREIACFAGIGVSSAIESAAQDPRSN
jgi:hypothetical protein